MLIASTSSVTIVFNAILSPLLLGEKFRVNPDGFTLILIGVGGTVAACQVPKQVELGKEE